MADVSSQDRLLRGDETNSASVYKSNVSSDIFLPMRFTQLTVWNIFLQVPTARAKLLLFSTALINQLTQDTLFFH